MEENENSLDDMINNLENELLGKDNVAADKKSSPEDEERIRKELEALKEATKRKETKCVDKNTESKKSEVKRKNLAYKKYIVPRIFLAIQTGFTSELAFWLGRKSTEDGIRKHIEDADD